MLAIQRFFLRSHEGVGGTGVIQVVLAVVVTVRLRAVPQHLAQLLALPAFYPSSHTVYSQFVH